jgi:hypothetical protein
MNRASSAQTGEEAAPQQKQIMDTPLRARLQSSRLAAHRVQQILANLNATEATTWSAPAVFHTFTVAKTPRNSISTLMSTKMMGAVSPLCMAAPNLLRSTTIQKLTVARQNGIVSEKCSADAN